MDYLIRFINNLDNESQIGGWELINQRFGSIAKSKHEHLYNAFRLIDFQNKGYLTEDDFIAITHAIHHSLVFVDISSPVFTFEDFGKTLFSVISNGKSKISSTDYIEGVYVSKKKKNYFFMYYQCS